MTHKLVLASAGSGKTTLLTDRIVDLLRGGAKPREIVAATFTRAATRDITRRLLERLSEQLSTTNTLDPAERAALSGAIERIAEIQILTLDSFLAAQVAADHTVALPDTRIMLDHVQDAAFVREAVANVANRIGVEALEALLLLLGKGRQRTLPRSALEQTATSLLPIHALVGTGGWLREIEHADGAFDRKLEAAERDDLLANLRLAGRDEAADLRARLRDDERIDAGQTIAAQNAATSAFLDAVLKEYMRLLEDRGFESLLSRIVTKRMTEPSQTSSSPGGRGLQHVLLDEFQDTSLEQWSALEPLIQELMSHADGSRSVTIVGDDKQAIYGFRGGVAALMNRLSTTPGIETAYGDRNYRASRRVLAASTAVFSRMPYFPFRGDAPSARAAATFGAAFRSPEGQSSDLGEVRLIRTVEHQQRTLATPPTKKRSRETQTVRRAGREESTFDAAAAQAVELSRRDDVRTVGVLVRTNAARDAIETRILETGPLDTKHATGAKTRRSTFTSLFSLLRVAANASDTAAWFDARAHRVCDAATWADVVGPLDSSRREENESAVRTASTRVKVALRSGGFSRLVRALVPEACVPSTEMPAFRTLIGIALELDSRAHVRSPLELETRFRQTVRDAQATTRKISVSTIHQSKGLEFDAVVLTDLDFPLSTCRDEVVFARDPQTLFPRTASRRGSAFERDALPAVQSLVRTREEDSAREALCLLYVGLTRARTVLHVVVPTELRRDNDRVTAAELVAWAWSTASASGPSF